ncbi:hypothetical protein B0H15DRAFT_458951 [Mycena belliarum]|uniref:DUF6697 domain-containing protein n=1 Tax=Mycena belliarum TaxID=1033014 RepID=A0AAD6UIX3_9AGAR|nr:hypothetical protein B0H15DRAFT_458951 [Mycena belliae]
MSLRSTSPTVLSSVGLSESTSSENVEDKATVKAELVSKIKEEGPYLNSDSEVAMLKALLAEKSKEALKRELALRTEILELEKQNKRLKLKRAADAAKMESLEAELARLKRAAVKHRKNDRQSLHSPSQERGSDEAIWVSDTEEEQGGDRGTPDALVGIQATLSASSMSPSIAPEEPVTTGDISASCEGEDKRHKSAFDVRSTPVEAQNASTSPSVDVLDLSISQRRPSRDAWGFSTDESSSRNPATPPNTKDAVKDELIDVVIKTEGGPDQFKRVSLIKSEDGNFDIWNVDGFDLGPTVEVEERFNRGFTRKVIGDAFGGGHVVCYHHWNPKPGQDAKTPFLTFNRSWNNALPVRPGLHGMGFFKMSDCPVKPQPLNFFAGEGENDWRLLGTYNYTRWGEIAPHHISLLPPQVLENWLHGMLTTEWGKSWIDDTNQKLKAARKVRISREGVLEALHDGRLAIPFTILQCVGYPGEWFERCIYYENHPKPKPVKKDTSVKRRGAPARARGAPKKRVKTLERERHFQVKREADDKDDGIDSDASESDRDDPEYIDGPRRIAVLPTRTSPRKLLRAISVEL